MNEVNIDRVIVDITNKCNLKCMMCANRCDPSRNIEMPVEVFKKIAEQTFPYAQKIWLSCSYESLMHSEFNKIMGYLDTECETTLITNGTLLNEDNIELIIESGMDWIFISFDGAKKETFDKIRNGARFEKVLSNIEMINEKKLNKNILNPELGFMVTLMMSNIIEFPEIVELARFLKISSIHCKPVHKTSVLPDNEMLIADDMIYDSFTEGMNLAKKYGIEFVVSTDLEKLMCLIHENNINNSSPLFPNSAGTTNSRRRGWCGEGSQSLQILPDGQMKPCTNWAIAPIGDFTKDNFLDIWNKDTFVKFRKAFDTNTPWKDCVNCEYYMPE